MGSPIAGVIGNSTLVMAGLYTGSSSARGYIRTNSVPGKLCYSMSILFSGSAIITGGGAALARTGRLSHHAALSETFAVGFMMMGKQAHSYALFLEGKRIPTNLQFRKSFSNPNGNTGLSFVMPGSTNGIVWSEVIESIPFEKIGRVVGIAISVYGYSKLIIASYRYGQQFVYKVQIRKKLAINRKKIKVFVMALLIRTKPSLYAKLLVT